MNITSEAYAYFEHRLKEVQQAMQNGRMPKTPHSN
jgi:hypothetical protein